MIKCKKTEHRRQTEEKRGKTSRNEAAKDVQHYKLNPTKTGLDKGIVMYWLF